MKWFSMRLTGRLVTLEPLAREHAEDLTTEALDPELWQWTTTAINDRQELQDYVLSALQEQESGRALPFVIRVNSSGVLAGCSRFGNPDLESARLEIGWTWIGRRHHGTGVNEAAKYLMLCHAFETLGAVRVEFKTDALNARSRAALAKIGATEEGTLRRHMRTWSGRIRDTVYYSILDTEWPAVKARLERIMDP